MTHALLRGISEQPFLLSTTNKRKGAIFQKESKLYITIETSHKLGESGESPNYYSGKFNSTFINVVEPRLLSSRVWGGAQGRIYQQQTMSYSYCLISTSKKFLSKDEVSAFVFDFPVLFWFPRNEQPQEILVENKDLKITSYTNNKNTVFRVTTKSPMAVEEIIRYRTRFERFFTSFMDTSVQAHETTLLSGKSYALLVSPDRSIDPRPEVVKGGRLLPPKKVMELLLAYMANFEKIGYATHLHASYVEYEDREIYIESRLSVLFAGIDAIYSKLSQHPTGKVVRRAEEYDSFIREIEETGIVDGHKKTVKFLKRRTTKDAYVSPVSFQDKLNAVFDFADVARLDPLLSHRLNTLRNNIAHGNDYNFDEFFTEWIDVDTSKSYPAIMGEHLEGISNATWLAILKLANQ